MMNLLRGFESMGWMFIGMGSLMGKNQTYVNV